eukprot:gene35935-46665_t
MSSLKDRATPSLPPLIHRYPGPIWTSQVPIEVKHQTLPLNSCKGYFNGTLHIILDLFLAPEYAHLPHMSLAVDNIPLIRTAMLDKTTVKQVRSNRQQRDKRKVKTRTQSRQQQIVVYNAQIIRMRLPHMGMYKKLFEGGEIDIEAANGMCFRRVAWGSGLRIHYADAMVVLRRLTADFARLLAMMTYNPPVPQPFLRISNLSSSMVYDNSSSQSLSRGMLLRDNGQPLRVVYLSRGPNGKGRSLTNIDVVLNRLTQSGASVFPCRESYANMTAQLSCVAHADVIIGLHGAALVNAIFAPRGCILVELKTLYGYTTDIFTRTADSREGMYIHIDIRNYSSPRRLHKADNILAGRIERALVEALAMKESNKQGEGRIHRLTATNDINNYLIEPSLTSGELGH